MTLKNKIRPTCILQQQHTRVKYHKVGSREDRMYVTLLLTRGYRETVFERPSGQVKLNKGVILFKYDTHLGVRVYEKTRGMSDFAVSLISLW